MSIKFVYSIFHLPMVWGFKIILNLNVMFTYNTILFIMQEKNCNLKQKEIIFGGMKVAVNIRMPEGMKKALDEIAAGEFRSLNSVILQFLDEQLKAKEIDWRQKHEKKAKE